MKLDYIENINTYGDNVVRLYDFDMKQADKFRLAIAKSIFIDKRELELKTLDFIQARNCELTLRVSNENEGISSIDNKTFFCDLTIEGYLQMINLLEPFCIKETKGYQWLYEVDSQTDFLFSPGGTW